MHASIAILTCSLRFCPLIRLCEQSSTGQLSSQKSDELSLPFALSQCNPQKGPHKYALVVIASV